MVYIQEVFEWFQDLGSYQRIDVMCELLRMCSSLELRFLGTCVEDLAKRDFHYLREAERGSNSAAYLAQLEELGDPAVRSKLIVSLALMDSSNHVGAGVIFKTLSSAWSSSSSSPSSPSSTSLHHQVDGVEKGAGPGNNLTEELLLLCTLATHHPAFTFDQKVRLTEMLKPVLKAHYCHNNTTTTGTVQALRPDSNVKNEPVLNMFVPACTQKQALPKTAVVNLELKKMVKRKAEKRCEFKIHVKWTTGEVKEVSKSYQELYEFSQKLQEEATKIVATNNHHQDKHIPALSAPRSNSNKQEDFAEETSKRMNSFLMQLVKLPQAVLECDLVTAFFQGSHNCPQQLLQVTTHATTMPTYSSQGVGSSAVRNVPQQSSNGGKLMRPDETSSQSGVATSATACIDDSGKPSQENHRGKIATSGTIAAVTNSASSVTTNPVDAGSSSATSSQPSPVSSTHTSPTQSGPSSRAASPWTSCSNSGAVVEAGMLKTIFKQDGLIKFRHKFVNATVEELKASTDEELTKEGLSPAAISILRKSLEALRISPLNGLNTHQLDKAIVAVGPSSPSVVPNAPAGGLSSAVAPAGSRQAAYVPPVVEHQTHPMSQQGVPQGVMSHNMMPLNSSAMVTSGILIQNMPTCTVQPCLQQTHYQQQAFHSHHRPHHYAPNSQVWMSSTSTSESSPSCSEFSSPPGSPALDLQATNADAASTEDAEKEKEIEKITAAAEIDHSKHPASKNRTKLRAPKYSSKQRIDEERVVTSISNTQTTDTTTTMTTKQHPANELMTLASSVSNCNKMVPGTFQRSRLTAVSSPSPPGTALNQFKQNAHQTSAASPVQNSSTMIFENSQMAKGAPATMVPPTMATAHNRWENVNGGSSNGSHVQLLNSNMHAMPTSTMASQPSSTSYRTFPSGVPASSAVVTTSSRAQNAITANAGVMRLHNKAATGPPLDDKHKMKSSMTSFSPTTMCISNLGQGGEATHLPTYPAMPMSYPSMPPSPVASTSVTYTTPAYLAASNGPSAASQTSTAITTHVHMSQGPSVMNPSGCSSNCASSCSSSTQPTNMTYQPGFLSVHQMGNPPVFTGFASFMHQPHSSNGFISPSALPNFPFPSNHLAAAAAAAGALPNGMTTDLMYSGSQFPMMQQNGSQHSNAGNPAFVAGQMAGQMAGHITNIAYHSNYNPSSQQSVPKTKNASCFNCGVVGHRGLDCKEPTMEDVTKPGQFRLNYRPSNSMEGAE